MRLDKMLSDCALASRSEIKKYVRQGRITVNGEVVKAADMKVNEISDVVCFDGKRVLYKKFVYLMLNKPEGYVSATEDKNDKTVLELVPEEYSGYDLFPAGRLDKYTTGLMILTNDGQFAHEALAPKKHVEKTYEVTLRDEPTLDDVKAFEEGVYIEGGYLTKPASLVLCGGNEAVITIHEGRYHQIKQMFGARGNKVVKLNRISFGGLKLPENLKKGEVIELTDNDLRAIFMQNAK